MTEVRNKMTDDGGQIFEFGIVNAECVTVCYAFFHLPHSAFRILLTSALTLQVFAAQRVPKRYKLVVFDDPDNVSQFAVTMLIEFDVAGDTRPGVLTQGFL